MRSKLVFLGVVSLMCQSVNSSRKMAVQNTCYVADTKIICGYNFVAPQIDDFP